MRFASTIPLFMLIFTFNLYRDVDSSQSEVAAGKAISKLLQEKISAKFKEAANDVKTILVKHLGASLQDAHSRMNSKKAKKAKKELAAATKKLGKKVAAVVQVSKSSLGVSTSMTIPIMEKTKRTQCDEECRTKKFAHHSKCHACKPHTIFREHKGASIHQNMAGRHRKNSGQVMGAVAPPKPALPQQQQQQQMSPYGMPLPGTGAAAQPQPQPRPIAPQQCGGNCPASCAPACDNTCCQMIQQQVPMQPMHVL